MHKVFWRETMWKRNGCNIKTRSGQTSYLMVIDGPSERSGWSLGRINVWFCPFFSLYDFRSSCYCFWNISHPSAHGCKTGTVRSGAFICATPITLIFWMDAYVTQLYIRADLISLFHILRESTLKPLIYGSLGLFPSFASWKEKIIAALFNEWGS